MIDIHAHILPTVDDGPRTTEESIKIFRKAAKDGIKTIVATPHILENPVERILNKIGEAIEELKQILFSEKIDIEIIRSAELFISPDLVRNIRKYKALTINGGNKYVLMELPIKEVPSYTEKTIFEFLVMGITPIIAHPERCIEIQKHPGIVANLLERGVLTQVNSGSLMGKYGKSVQKTARRLLSSNFIHMIGSDIHSTFAGPYPLLQGVNATARIVGKKRAIEMVTSIPAKVLNGHSL